MFWIETQGSMITTLGRTEANVPLNEGQIEITKETAQKIKVLPLGYYLEGNNIVPYTPVEVKISNTNPEAMEQVNISALTPDKQGDGIEVVLYIDGEEQAHGQMPCTWPVIFEIPGTYTVEIDAGRHGRIKKQVVVE